MKAGMSEAVRGIELKIGDEIKSKIAPIKIRGEILERTEFAGDPASKVRLADGSTMVIPDDDAILFRTKDEIARGEQGWSRPVIPEGSGGNPSEDERLLKVVIEHEPLRVAKQWGYEVHRLSPTDIVDKEDYARGYRYRLSKADPTQPYPQIVMARSEGEVATFLKRHLEGNPDPATEYWRDSMSGEEIARELGLRYDGIQEGIGMQFTDIHQTGTTFYANTLEETRVKLAEKRELFKRGENPSTAHGTCYEDAWRFLIREEEGDLVHGTVLSLSKRIGHAWVELPTSFIWEPGSRQFIKKADFQAMAKPQEEHRYTGEEAAIMLARVGKHGPWTEQERLMLKRGNPMGKVINKEEAIGLLERLSMTPDEAMRSLFGSEEEGQVIMKAVQERVKREQNKWAPMDPREGPPLPRVFAGLRWPWRK